jgi:hypothetical protein
MTSALGTHDPGAPGAAVYPLSGGTDNKALGLASRAGFAPLKLLPELIFPPCSMALTSARRLDALVFLGRRVLGTAA